VLNAANEVCVQAFLAGDLGFLQIADTVAVVVQEALAQQRVGSEQHPAADPDGEPLTVEAVVAADASARERAATLVDEYGGE